MKNSIAITACTLLFLFISCRKSVNNHENDGSIAGKWNIVVDSTYQGVGVNNHLVVYTGQVDDYFDFNDNGNLFVRENNSPDTFSYHVTSGSDIIITDLGKSTSFFPDTIHIIHLTSHDAALTTGWSLTPGGIFGRSVVLKR